MRENLPIDKAAAVLRGMRQLADAFRPVFFAAASAMRQFAETAGTAIHGTIEREATLRAVQLNIPLSKARRLVRANRTA